MTDTDKGGERRFIECEKWRKEFGTDDLVRNFEYTEKPQVFEYYPQYYHKTDKVGSSLESIISLPWPSRHMLNHSRLQLGWETRLHREAGKDRPQCDVQDHDRRADAPKPRV